MALRDTFFRCKDAVQRFFQKKPIRITVGALSAVGKCLITVLLIGVITFTLVASVMVVYVVTNFDGREGLPDLDDLSINETSVVYTRNSDGQWQEFVRLEGTDSVWTDMDDIPLNMQLAVVAIEDKRFFEHDGVDWKRTVAASLNLVLHFQSVEFGGSTITQQLIKVTTGDNDQTIRRKITEIMRAVYLENDLSGSKSERKEQILEAYLNVLPLSGNITGVGAAALNYFDKDVSELSLAECAAIAGITQNPSKYNPFTHPENLRQRQRTVLYAMFEQGYITEDEYIQAVNEELHFKHSSTRVSTQDYYTDLLIEEVAADLMDTYGYPYAQAISKIYHGGLSIYSNENPEIQAKAEAIYADDANFPDHLEADSEDPTGAIFVIDYDGNVVATVGNRGTKTGNRLYNMSTDARRQCGSSIKPLGSYAPAVMMNLIHFSSLVPDSPITLADGTEWPPNYGSSVRDNGYKTVAYALQQSLNTVAAQLVQSVTLDESYSFLTNRLNFGLTDADKTYSGLALGGFAYGVTCREMAEGYQIFGNGGYYTETSTYTKVEQDGEVLLQPIHTPVQVMDEDSAYVMNRLMQRVVRNGTGAGISGSWGGGWEVFAKTGTSGGSKRGGDTDVYFAGGTTQYVAASWFGYPTYNKGLSSRQQGYARSLWNQVMVAIRDNSYDEKGFTQKGDTIEAKFCTETGLLCGEHNTCPNSWVGVYKPDNMPGYCDQHTDGTSTTPEGSGDGGNSTSSQVTIDLGSIYGTTTAEPPTSPTEAGDAA